MKASTAMETIVASGSGCVHKGLFWAAIAGFDDCGLRDNKVGNNSYFDEADMNS